MKASIILSAAIALFSVFVAASPVDSAPALVPRNDAAGADIISTITTAQTNLDALHLKYKTKCSTVCSSADIYNWQKEVSTLITLVVNTICGTHSGFTFLDPSNLVSIICAIIVGINTTLTFLLGRCGLLTGLLITILSIVNGLLIDLVLALNALLSCLDVFIVGSLLSLVTTLLGTLLGSTTCFCCGLLNIIL